ncbi:MAG: hypothetical protein DRH70_06935 [Candidatus Coatesbacteria bacterium]|nr:MAG: hypothetical protein DRH70_06935 [Candidatus Coatesbacteria bacterium]
MIWSWIGKLLLFLLGGLLLLQALLLKIKADRTASLVELAFAGDALALLVWRIYSFLLGDKTGLQPTSAIAVCVPAIVYVVAARMLRRRKVGLLVWAAMSLAIFFSFAFLVTQEGGATYFPGLSSGSERISTLELEKQKQQNRDYLGSIELSDVKARYYEDRIHGHSILLECEIRNTGLRDVGTLTLSATLLSDDGAIIHQEDFYPVSKNSPLPAGNKLHMLSRFSQTPKAWNPKNLDVRITELRLAGNLMISAATFPRFSGKKDK